MHTYAFVITGWVGTGTIESLYLLVAALQGSDAGPEAVSDLVYTGWYNLSGFIHVSISYLEIQPFDGPPTE